MLALKNIAMQVVNPNTLKHLGFNELNKIEGCSCNLQHPQNRHMSTSSEADWVVLVIMKKTTQSLTCFPFIGILNKSALIATLVKAWYLFKKIACENRRRLYNFILILYL